MLGNAYIGIAGAHSPQPGWQAESRDEIVGFLTSCARLLIRMVDNLVGTNYNRLCAGSELLIGEDSLNSHIFDFGQTVLQSLGFGVTNALIFLPSNNIY